MARHWLPRPNNGGAGNDTITGRAGNDTLDGGPGNDVILSSDGTDFVSFASAISGVTVSPASFTSNNTGSQDTFTGIYNIILSDYNDSVTGGTGFYIIGGAGNDTIVGATNGSIEGGAGNDLLSNTNGNARILYQTATSGVTVNMIEGSATGGGGNDTFSGFNWFTGSDYNDSLLASSHGNQISLGRGDDTVDG